MKYSDLTRSLYLDESDEYLQWCKIIISIDLKPPSYHFLSYENEILFLQTLFYRTLFNIICQTFWSLEHGHVCLYWYNICNSSTTSYGIGWTSLLYYCINIIWCRKLQVRFCSLSAHMPGLVAGPPSVALCEGSDDQVAGGEAEGSVVMTRKWSRQCSAVWRGINRTECHRHRTGENTRKLLRADGSVGLGGCCKQEAEGTGTGHWGQWRKGSRW